MNDTDTAAWHQMMLEQEQELDEAVKRVENGTATADDAALLRGALGLKQPINHSKRE